MNYSDIGLKLSTGTSCFMINPEQRVNVLSYLPIEDKNAIIQLAIQNAEENGMINDLMLDMYFNLYVIYMYTDIEFTEDEKNDPVTLYDVLESNGIIEATINSIPKQEWLYLNEKLHCMAAKKMARRNSVAATIQNFIELLPKNAEAANEIIKNFNPEDFQAVINFARQANGNRPIN